MSKDRTGDVLYRIEEVEPKERLPLAKELLARAESAQMLEVACLTAAVVAKDQPKVDRWTARTRRVSGSIELLRDVIEIMEGRSKGAVEMALFEETIS